MNKNQITKVVSLTPTNNTCLISVPFLVSKIVVEASHTDDPHPHLNVAPFIMCRTDLIGVYDEIPISYNGMVSVISNNTPRAITYLFPNRVDINRLYTFDFYDAFNPPPTGVSLNTLLRTNIIFTFYE